MANDLEIKVKLGIDDLQKGIDQSRAAIKSLDKEKASIILDLKKEQLQEDFNKIRADLRALSSPDLVRPITFEIDKQKLEASIAEVQQKLKSLSEQKATKEIKIEKASAENQLKVFTADLKRLEATKTKAEIELQKEKALGDLAQLKSQLKGLDTLKIDIEVPKNSALELQAISQSFGAIAEKINELKGAAVGAFKDFDTARTKLATITPEGNKLAESLKGVSADLKFQASATELANAGYTVLSGGFTKAADASLVLKASTVGAVGGFSDVDTVSRALVSTLNAYGLSAKDASSVVDKFASVQQNGIITINEYAQQIAKVAPLAKSAGIGLDELNGFIATATASGVPAEQVFTGLRAAISATLKPSSEASKLAQELGISFDAQALKTKGLSGILGELRAKSADSSENLAVLFGSMEAVTALTPSAGAGFQKLSANILASANSAGIAQQNFDKVAGSLEGRLKAFQNEANLALVTLGEGITKISSPVVASITSVIRAFNALPQPLKDAIAVLVGGGAAIAAAGAAIAGIAAVAQPTIAGLTLLSGAAGKLTTFLGTSVVQMLSFSGASSSAAAGATAAGVAAEGASLGFKAMATSIGGAIAQVALLYLAFESVKNSFDIVSTLATGSTEGTRSIDALTQSLKGTAQAANDSGNAFSAFFDGVVAGADRARNPIEAVAQGFINLDNAILSTLSGGNLGNNSGADKLGDQFSLISYAQQEAQINTLKLQKTFESFNPTLNKTRDLLKEYGLGLNAEANATRLSLDRKKEFVELAERQIKVEQNEIDVIKKVGANRGLNQDAIALQVQTRESDIRSLQTRIGLLGDEAKANTNSAASAKQQSEALKAQLTDQAKLLKDREDIERNALSKKQELSRQETQKAQEKGIETKRDDALNALKIQQEKEIGAFKQQQENALGEKKRAFEKEIASFKDQSESKLKEKERSFQAGQKADADRFQKRQQADADAFQKRQQASDEQYQKKKEAAQKALQDSLSGAKTIVDRESQISSADPAQAEKLKKQFAEEDRIKQAVLSTNVDKNATKEQFVGQAKQISGVSQIKSQEDAAKVQLALAELEAKAKAQLAEEERAKDKEYAEKKAAAEAAFKEEQRNLETAFSEKQKADALGFEEKTLKPLRENLAKQLQEKELAFKQNILQPFELKQKEELSKFEQLKSAESNALKLKFEGELDALRKASKLAEIDLDTKAQKEKLDRELAFKNEQRKLDLQTAQQIAQTLSAASAGKLGSTFGVEGRVLDPSKAIANLPKIDANAARSSTSSTTNNTGGRSLNIDKLIMQTPDPVADIQKMYHNVSKIFGG